MIDMALIHVLDMTIKTNRNKVSALAQGLSDPRYKN